MAIKLTPGKPFTYPTLEDYSEALSHMDTESQEAFKADFGKPMLEEDIKDAHKALDKAIEQPGATIAIAAILNEGVPTNDGAVIQTVSFLGANGSYSTNAVRCLIGTMATRLLETTLSGEPEDADIQAIKEQLFEHLMLEIQDAFEAVTDPRNKDLRTHILDQLRGTAK